MEQIKNTILIFKINGRHWQTPGVCQGKGVVMKRQGLIYPGEYYHVFNRGNNKQIICYDTRDYARLLFLILTCQSPSTFDHLGRHVSHYIKHGTLKITQKQHREMVNTRYVELVGFSIMPNHFHILVYEKDEDGIMRYLHRVQTAYAKYINIRYDKKGHLFQGPYKAVHVSSNVQLLHTSAYIHMNPVEIHGVNIPEKFQWSSFQDYIFNNRWNDLLMKNHIIEQFSSKSSYADYVKRSGAKS